MALRNFFTEPLAPHEELTSVPRPRTRVRDELLPHNSYSSHWYNSQAPLPHPGYSAGIWKGTHRVMTDFVTKRFKELSANGQIVNTPMSQDITKCMIFQEDGCSFRATYPSITYYGFITGPWLSMMPKTRDSIRSHVMYACDTTLGLDPDRAGLIVEASTQARANKDKPDFSGLVSLGELRETLRYLRNPFQGGLVLASKLERQVGRRSSSSGDKASALAGLYLGFRYGLRPLVKEIENALETLHNVLGRPIRQTYRGKAVGTDEGSQTSIANNGGITCTETLYCKRTITVRCGFLEQYEVDSGLNERWGMRLSDLPQSLWELIPLSFLVDWVANVRAFIGALSPSMGSKTLAGWTTIRDVRQLLLTGEEYAFPGTDYVCTSPSAVNSIGMEVTSVTRQPTVNSPGLEWRGFDTLANDVSRLFDITGIFGQKLNNFAQREVLTDQRRDLLNARTERYARFANSRFQKNWFLPR